MLWPCTFVSFSDLEQKIVPKYISNINISLFTFILVGSKAEEIEREVQNGGGNLSCWAILVLNLNSSYIYFTIIIYVTDKTVSLTKHLCVNKTKFSADCDGCRGWFHKAGIQIPWTSYEPITNMITNYSCRTTNHSKQIEALK